MAAKIINEINVPSNAGGTKIKVVIDCPSTNRVKWRDTVQTKVENLSNLEVLCEHKADVNHVAVSAASILAKVTREDEARNVQTVEAPVTARSVLGRWIIRRPRWPVPAPAETHTFLPVTVTAFS